MKYPGDFDRGVNKEGKLQSRSLHYISNEFSSKYAELLGVVEDNNHIIYV